MYPLKVSICVMRMIRTAKFLVDSCDIGISRPSYFAQHNCMFPGKRAHFCEATDPRDPALALRCCASKPLRLINCEVGVSKDNAAGCKASV